MSSRVLLSTAVIPPPITGVEDPELIQQLTYNPLLFLDWKQHAKDSGWRLQDFAVSGWAHRFSCKIMADFHVYIRIKGKNKRFRVDPHDESWYDRLCDEIGQCAGVPGQGRMHLYLGERELTSDPESLDALANAPRNSLRITLDTAAEAPSQSIPVRPVYAVNVAPTLESLNGIVSASAASSAVSSAERREDVDRAVNSLVDAFKASALRVLPKALAENKDSDYATLAAVVIKHISSDAFYESSHRGGSASFWKTLGCPNSASVTSEIGRELAAKAMKIQSADPSMYQRSLIGDSMWKKLKQRARRWMCNARMYNPCPMPAKYQEPRDLSCDPRMIAASMEATSSATLTQSIGTKLIECSRNHYGGSGKKHHKHHHHADEDSSDDEPTHESIKCSVRNSHLHRVAPNATACKTGVPVGHRGTTIKCEKLKYHHGHKHEKEHEHQSQSQTIVLMPLPAAQLPIGKKMGGSSHHVHGGPPGQMNKGTRIYLGKHTADGNVQTYPVKHTQNVGAELAGLPEVAGIECGACGGKKRIQEKDDKTGEVRHIDCPYCPAGRKKAQEEAELRKKREAAAAAAAAASTPAVKDSGPHFGGGGGGGSGGFGGHSGGGGGGFSSHSSSHTDSHTTSHTTSHTSGHSSGHNNGGFGHHDRRPPGHAYGHDHYGNQGHHGGLHYNRDGRYHTGNGYGHAYGRNHPRWTHLHNDARFSERERLRRNLRHLNAIERRRLYEIDAELLALEMEVYGPEYVAYEYPPNYFYGLGLPERPGVHVGGFGLGAGVNAFGQPVTQIGPLRIVGEDVSSSSAAAVAAKDNNRTISVRGVNLTSDNALHFKVIYDNTATGTEMPIASAEATEYFTVSASSFASITTGVIKKDLPLRDGARYTVLLFDDPAKTLLVEDESVPLPAQGRSKIRVLLGLSDLDASDDYTVEFVLGSASTAVRSFPKLSKQVRFSTYMFVAANHYTVVLKKNGAELARIPGAEIMQRNTYTFIIEQDHGTYSFLRLIDERFQKAKYDEFRAQVDEMFKAVDVRTITGGLMLVPTSGADGSKAVDYYTTNPAEGGGVEVLDRKSADGSRIEFQTDTKHKITFNRAATAVVDKNGQEVPIQAIFTHPLNPQVMVVVLDGTVDKFETVA